MPPSLAGRLVADWPWPHVTFVRLSTRVTRERENAQALYKIRVGCNHELNRRGANCGLGHSEYSPHNSKPPACSHSCAALGPWSLPLGHGSGTVATSGVITIKPSKGTTLNKATKCALGKPVTYRGKTYTEGLHCDIYSERF